MYSGPIDNVVSVEPTARCTGKAGCSQIHQINTSIENEQGKCSALLTREGFFDFFVFNTQCNVPHNVAVVCQHNNINLVVSNHMSDIKLSLADGFQSIHVFSSCDPGWFKIDDACINLYLCHNCVKIDCTKYHAASYGQCQKHGGHLAYHVLKNITLSTLGNILDKNTKLSLFWNMFHHIDDLDFSHGKVFKHWRNFRSFKYPDKTKVENRKNFAVNGTGICEASLNHTCKNRDIVLSVRYIDLILSEYGGYYFVSYIRDMYFQAMWSVIHQPAFQVSNCSEYSLCEKPVVHNAILTNCSEFYMSCSEGTCIHDSLVCDGHSHCPDGEDEAECEQICSLITHPVVCLTVITEIFALAHLNTFSVCQEVVCHCKRYVTKQCIAVMHLMSPPHVCI